MGIRAQRQYPKCVAIARPPGWAIQTVTRIWAAPGWENGWPLVNRHEYHTRCSKLMKIVISDKWNIIVFNDQSPHLTICDGKIAILNRQITVCTIYKCAMASITMSSKKYWWLHPASPVASYGNQSVAQDFHRIMGYDCWWYIRCHIYMYYNSTHDRMINVQLGLLGPAVIVKLTKIGR